MVPHDRVELQSDEIPFLSGIYFLSDQGVVELPSQPPVVLAGLTEAQATDELTKILGTRVKVSWKGRKPGPVAAVGAFKTPLAFPISAGMKVVDLLNLAIPQDFADLDRAVFERADGQILTLNLQGWSSGDFADNLLLKPGDWLRLNKRQGPSHVAVSGSVMRPGTVSFRAGITLNDAIQAVGGPRPGADWNRIRIKRNGAVYRTVDLRTEGGLKLQAGDTVFVPGDPQARLVRIDGAVRQPAEIAWQRGLRLSQMILEAGGFKLDMDLEHVRILRKSDGPQRVVTVNFWQSKSDPELLPYDEITIPALDAAGTVAAKARLGLLLRRLGTLKP